MAKYTHEEINAMRALAIESPIRLDLPDYKKDLYKEAPAIIRQLLEEYEALDVKRAYFQNLARQQGKRIEQLEAALSRSQDDRVSAILSERAWINQALTSIKDGRKKDEHISRLEAALAEHKALDPLANIPPFDWGPEGESKGESPL